MSTPSRHRYRADGVRITHDPYAPGIREKYGNLGETDPDGFDPYSDTVGPGIYGGCVERDERGDIVLGMQYQCHNPVPGPVYTGRGYTKMNKALREGPEAAVRLLKEDGSLVNETSTGGASPLHMCGMSARSQYLCELLIDRGGVVDALDTYGYTPLHRMSSNNLDVGAHTLLRHGANPNTRTKSGETPMSIATASRALKVIEVLRLFGGK